MCLAIGEEVIDDHADDGEEEHDETPDDLLSNSTVGFDDLN